MYSIIFVLSEFTGTVVILTIAVKALSLLLSARSSYFDRYQEL